MNCRVNLYFANVRLFKNRLFCQEFSANICARFAEASAEGTDLAVDWLTEKALCDDK